MNTINKTWFRNRLKNNELVVKCLGIYSDDYKFDADNNFFRDEEFREVKEFEFKDIDIKNAKIWGDKNGIIKFNIYHYRSYEFQLKTNLSKL